MLAEPKHTSLLPGSSPVLETELSDAKTLAETLETLSEPRVFRGLVRDWPLVQAGLRSRAELGDYLQGFYSGVPLTTSMGPPSIKGRIGYNDGFTGFNYQRVQMQLTEFLELIAKAAQEEPPPTLYVGSSLLEHWFPGMCEKNSVSPSVVKPLASLWLGNRVVVSAHFDVPDNLACCVSGQRRFTLFPPDQLENLYTGPWDLTPAGQPVSLVDLHAPDLDRFPKFARAMQTALEAVLEPGDALFIPSMWWHHVEGLDALNLLLNYWWRNTPAYMGSPLHVLKHAFLSLRALPPTERKVWKELFDYHIFESSRDSVAHIPEHARGIHGPMDENRARALRAELLNVLNR